MRYVCIIFTFLIGLSAQSQKSAVIFYNPDVQKAVQVPKGGMLMLQYRGYLKQMELKTNYVIDMNDSTIVMGKPRLFSDAADIKRIRINDITGFRKISAGSQFLKTAITVGATLGAYYALRENGDDLSSTQQLLLSTGAGVITHISVKFIFPDNKIKHRTKDGWIIFAR